MKPHSWRDIAKPIIAKVLADNKGAEKSVIRKALRDAYPFGERRYHPYKIWLLEIKAQLGKKSRKKKVEQLQDKQLLLF